MDDGYNSMYSNVKYKWRHPKERHCIPALNPSVTV